MLTVSNTLLMSSATVIMRFGGLFWLIETCCGCVVYVM